MSHQTLARTSKPGKRSGDQKRVKPRHQAGASIHPLLTLQRSVGNQAAQRLMRTANIQAKLKISQPGDKFEREADHVASAVMRSPISRTEGTTVSPALSISRVAGEAAQREKDTDALSEQVQKEEEQDSIQRQADEDNVQTEGKQDNVQRKTEDNSVQKEEKEDSVQQQADEDGVQTKAKQDTAQREAQDNSVQKEEQGDFQPQARDDNVQKEEEDSLQSQAEDAPQAGPGRNKKSSRARDTASPALSISRVAGATAQRENVSPEARSTEPAVQRSSRSPLRQHLQPDEGFIESGSPLRQHLQSDEGFIESRSPLRQHPQLDEEFCGSRSLFVQRKDTDAVPEQVQKEEEQDSVQQQAEHDSVQKQAKQNNVQRETEDNSVQKEEKEGRVQQQADEDSVQMEAKPDAVQREAQDNSVQKEEQGDAQPQARDDNVQKEDENSVQSQAEDNSIQKQEEDSVQEQAEEDSVQREAKKEESVARQESEENVQPIQRKAGEPADVMPVGARQPEAPQGFAADLHRTSGEGQPMPLQTQAFFESRFQAGFSSVRLHTGANASRMNRAIHARAFTRGSDIYFSDGALNPSSSQGKTLLAHELTHVVQQGHAAPAPAARAQSGVVQRQESEAVDDMPSETTDDAPSEAEKAAALAAAARAEKVAAQAASEGKEEISKSRQMKEEESQAQQEATQEKQSASSEADKKTVKAKKGKEKATFMAPSPKVPSPEQAEGGAGGGLAEKAPSSPDEDPAFQGVVKKIGAVASKQKSHPSAQSKAAEAQAASASPPEEITGRAQDTHTGQMEKTETPAFDAPAFKAQLLKRIQELAPKTVEQADEFKENNKLGAVKQEMSGKVATEKAASQGPLDAKKDEAPDTKSVEPKPVTPIPEPEPGAAPPKAGASAAAPKAKTEGEVEAPIQENTQRVGQELEKENITEEQLAKSNEPQFQEALSSKHQAEANAAEGPPAYRKAEQSKLGEAEAQAEANAATRTKSMHAGRADSLSQVHGMQGQTKTKDEAARREVGQHIQGIYDKTKSEVDRILSELDGKVEKAFDEGAQAAKQVFEDYVGAQMEAYKQERYGGWFGWARWTKDKLLGMPSEVDVFYTRGRDLYLRKMDAVIETVVAIVDAGLTSAKAEIAKGRKEIADYLAGLPDSLKSVGAEAAENANNLFQALEENVNNKQNELIDTLANKYQESLKEIDDRIEELQAANRGLVDKAIDAVKGVIKTIIELKNLLLRVLAKIADVVLTIIADPIGFLKNMIAAVRLGLDNFIGKIGTHLKAGFIGWLTGALGSLNIQMPEDVFSLKGIFSLIMQILGLTWDYVRSKAVKLLGEPVVKALETGFTLFQILIKEGPAGLWEYAKEKFADLKEMVIEQIKSMLITQVITAGIKWLLGLLNPVAAFIKAAIAIYDIVSFFMEKAKQILELIEAFVDGVAAVAKGSIDAAAKFIENALVKALPMVIGFLASLLGIGGLAARVQKLFLSFRERKDKFIDGLILKAKKFARKLLTKLTPGKRGKVVDEKEQKKHEAIGKAVAEEMAKPPSEPTPYEQLRAQKETQAQSLIGKYGGQLKPPVKLKIEFRSPEKDRQDGDLDFKVRIAPNDFTIEKAVEGKAGGIPPKVGTFRDLKKAPDREAHHVPPKGLLGWIRREARDAASKMTKKDRQKYSWISKVSQISDVAINPGNPLAAISIDMHTHIKKIGNIEKDAYRAHWGEGTAREVLERLSKKGLRLIYRQRFDQLSNEDKAEFQELAKEANQDPAALKAAEEKILAGEGKVLSTQFFKTELSEALKQERSIKEQDQQGLSRALGTVAKGAHLQSHEAVTVALEKSDRDGTKEERASALSGLKSKSEETWNKQPGIPEIKMF